MPPVPANPSATLVIAHPDLLHQPHPPAAGDLLTLVSLPASATPTGRAMTMHLEWSRLGPLDAITRTADGIQRVDYCCDGAALFDGLCPGAALRLAAKTGGFGPAGAGHAPLFCTVATEAGLDLFSRVRFHPGEALFLRTTAEPLPLSPAEGDPDWLATALRLHAEQAGALNSHERHYRKAFPGQELEHKLTLPSDVPIWDLAADLHRRVARGELAGLVLCHRDDLQVWDFHNHLFEVTAPVDQIGYVSFMSTSDTGVYRIKRKRFTADALVRYETLSPEIRPERPLGDYVRDVLGLEASPLPPFRRVRYDISVESPATGHIFGIFLDRCRLMAAPEITLTQCEIEYLNTRTVFPPDEQQIITQLDEVTTWVEQILTPQGLVVDRGYYSKLSFLRDAVAQHPGVLAPTLLGASR
ncbi:MAG: hypothetical protein JXA67_17045 [Micromonosporaceae bacterium]|nr:hypothetical protein [Micromonosporaceae bacterium]